MSKFKIIGPAKLKGEIPVFGAKNAAMKMVAASVLTKKEVILHNVPDISDIQTIIEILITNGAKITRDKNTLTINTADLSSMSPDRRLVEKIRGSIVLIGPYLARFGRLSVPKPGGCSIGSRSIETHLNGFRQLGLKESFADHIFTLEMPEKTGGTVNLTEASVTATENLIMYATLANGQTIINNAACEPEIIDLAEFLNSLGAKISGAGESQIIIDGVNELNAGEYSTMPDRIEAGTFAALSIVTKSPLKITHCRPKDLTSFLAKIQEMGVEFETGEDYLEIKNFDNLKPIKIETAIHPGFPTDLQAPMGLILTQANGVSELTETLYENRLNYFYELEKMGATFEMADSKKVIIHGPTKLHGAKIDSLDLRAGATLILAGLAAEGETIISKAEIVNRGYEKIEERLKALGANIERIED